MAVVRYFAGARAAAGVAEETLPAGTVAELAALAGARHGAALDRVLAACSYLVDGVACHHPTTPLTESSTVDVLPPFAGG